MNNQTHRIILKIVGFQQCNDCNFVPLEYQKRRQLIVRWNKEKKLDVLGLSVRGESYGPWKTKQYIICRKLIKSTLRFWGTKRLFHPNF